MKALITMTLIALFTSAGMASTSEEICLEQLREAQMRCQEDLDAHADQDIPDCEKSYLKHVLKLTEGRDYLVKRTIENWRFRETLSCP